MQEIVLFLYSDTNTQTRWPCNKELYKLTFNCCWLDMQTTGLDHLIWILRQTQHIFSSILVRKDGSGANNSQSISKIIKTNSTGPGPTTSESICVWFTSYLNSTGFVAINIYINTWLVALGQLRWDDWEVYKTIPHFN